MSTSETGTGTDTRSVVRGYFEAVGRRDRNAQLDWYADDASGRIFGVIGPGSRDEMRDFFAGVFDAFPDFHLRILDLLVEGDMAVVRWRATGTFSGSRPFEGLVPTGRDVDIEGCDMVWVRDGRVARVEAYYDTATMARQLGALPPKGSPAERAMLGVLNAGTRARRALRERRG